MVNVHKAKTELSRLLEAVEAGEEVVIARAGRPVARLTALPADARTPGCLAGRINIAADFDDPLPSGLLRGFGVPPS